jgi:hypothetical protein
VPYDARLLSGRLLSEGLFFLLPHHETVTELDLGGEAIGGRIGLGVDGDGATGIQLLDVGIGVHRNVVGATDFAVGWTDVVIGEQVWRGALAAAGAEDEDQGLPRARCAHLADDVEGGVSEGDVHAAARVVSAAWK